MADKVISLDKVRNYVSALVSRGRLASLAGKTFDGDRDLYKWLGYKRALVYEDYQSRYDRGGIAGRVVDTWPQATWRVPPILISDDDKFVEDFNELAVRLSLWHVLERVDKLAGIGRYAGLLVGFKGGAKLDIPPTKVRDAFGILYVTPLSEINAKIHSFESDPANERFGRPSEYKVTLNRSHDGSAISNPTPSGEIRVHHSRLLHVADGLLEDNLLGTPRLQRPWNYLDDLDKIVGGGAEAMWRTVDRGMQFDIDKDAVLDPSDATAFEEEIEAYTNQLKRFIKTQGVKITPLGGNVIDNSRAILAYIGLISGTTGIPQRILLGSEAGQLASDQDERNFNSRVKERQKSFAEVSMLRPFINLLGQFGALTIPKDGYKVKWPDISTQTDREKADIAARNAQAILSVSKQPKDMIVMPVEEFRKRFIDREGD